MCYFALYLWLVSFMYRASGFAAFSFGRLISGPINAHFFFESSGAVYCLFSFYLSRLFGPFLFQLLPGFALLYSLPCAVWLHFCLCLFLLPLGSEPWATVVHVVALIQGSSLLPPLELVLLLPALWLLFSAVALEWQPWILVCLLLCCVVTQVWVVCLCRLVCFHHWFLRHIRLFRGLCSVCPVFWAPVRDGVPCAAMAA